MIVLREAVPVCRSELMLIFFRAVLSSVDLEIYLDGGIFVYFLSKKIGINRIICVEYQFTIVHEKANWEG